MCALMARKATLRAAGQRYQKSRRGQHQHAERQKRYRLAHRKIVTHHTSKRLPFNDLLLSTLNETSDNTEHISMTSDNRCYFCGNLIHLGIFHGLYS